MDAFTVTTLIDRPQQEVFDLMSDPSNFPQWQRGTESAGWDSEGPVGVGSIFHVEGRLLGKKLVMDAEITQWDPPTSRGMNASSGPMEGALLKGESLKWCHGLALTLSHPFGTICYGKQP